MKQAEQESDPRSACIIESTYLKFAPLPGNAVFLALTYSAQPKALISPFTGFLLFLLLEFPTLSTTGSGHSPTFLPPHRAGKSRLCCSQFSRSPVAFGWPSISLCFHPDCALFPSCMYSLKIPTQAECLNISGASPKSPSTHFLSKVLDHGMQLLFQYFSC